MADPYAILGVPRSATEAEIKGAYRRLAMLHHPDRGGSAQKFIELTAAYEFCVENIGQPFTRSTAKSTPEPERQPDTEPEPVYSAADIERMFRDKMAEVRAHPERYAEDIEEFRRELHAANPVGFLLMSLREAFSLPWRDFKNALRRK